MLLITIYYNKKVLLHWPFYFIVLIFLLELFVQKHVLPSLQPSSQFLWVKKWPSNYCRPKSFIAQTKVLISAISSTSLANVPSYIDY